MQVYHTHVGRKINQCAAYAEVAIWKAVKALNKGG